MLRRGLSPLAVAIATPVAAPVVAGYGPAAPAQAAAWRPCWVEAINTAVAVGARPGDILVRGDAAYRSGKAVATVVTAAAAFSFTITRNPSVDAAIASIPDEQFTPVDYPGAAVDPDTGQLISAAQVADVPYNARWAVMSEKTRTMAATAEACIIHRTNLFQLDKPDDEDEAKGKIDMDIVSELADRLWLGVLSEKQEQLLISPEDRALIKQHRVKEGRE